MATWFIPTATDVDSRGYLDLITPEVAAEAALAAWEEHGNDSGEVTIEVSPEVEAIIKARGSIPWVRQS